jgi:hypothetical protein
MSERNRTLGTLVLEHWERLSKCTTLEEVQEEGYGVSDCAFCREYIYEDEPCRGCPVFEDTGVLGCKETPYVAFTKALDLHNLDDYPFPAALIKDEQAYLTELIGSLEE